MSGKVLGVRSWVEELLMAGLVSPGPGSQGNENGDEMGSWTDAPTCPIRCWCRLGASDLDPQLILARCSVLHV